MTAIAGGGIRTNRHSNQLSHGTTVSGSQLNESSGTGGTGRVSGVDARMARKGYGESIGAFERLGTIYDWVTVPASDGLAEGVGEALAEGISTAAAVATGTATGATSAEAYSPPVVSLRTVVSWVELSGTAAEVEYASGAGAAVGTGAAAAVGSAIVAAVGRLGHQLGTARNSTVILTTTTTKLAQSFTIDAASLVSVNVPAYKNGSATGNVTAKIYLADVDDLPTGSQIGDTASIDVDSLADLATTFVFPLPIDLVADTYVVVFEHSVPSNSPNHINFIVASTDVYSGGQYSQLASSVWTTYSNIDLFGFLNFTSVGRANAVGDSTVGVDAVGAADGVGAASAVGEQTAAAVGASAGIGTASAVGASSSIGAATGTGAGQATSAQTASGAGSATGTGATNGAAIAGVAGNAAGVGAASAVGASIFSAVGSAAGEGLLVGDSGGLAFGAGDAAGIGAASAVGTSMAAAAGVAAGTSTAQATGAKTSASVGAASAVGTAAAVGATEGGEVIVSGVGTAAGTGDADGRSPRRRPSAGLGGLFRFGPAVIEGVGYGILPELEGDAVGTVGQRKTIAGRAKGVVALTGHASCDIGVKGVAYSIARLPLMASAPAHAGSAGQAQVNLSICKGAAMGDHDPDEHVVIALMMAA